LIKNLTTQKKVTLQSRRITETEPDGTCPRPSIHKVLNIIHKVFHIIMSTTPSPEKLGNIVFPAFLAEEKERSG